MPGRGAVARLPLAAAHDEGARVSQGASTAYR